jgi:hypothetical protein
MVMTPGLMKHHLRFSEMESQSRLGEEEAGETSNLLLVDVDVRLVGARQGDQKDQFRWPLAQQLQCVATSSSLCHEGVVLGLPLSASCCSSSSSPSRLSLLP